MLSAHVSATNSFKFTKPFWKKFCCHLLGWPLVQFWSKFLKYSINHLTGRPLGLAIKNSDQKSFLLLLRKSDQNSGQTIVMYLKIYQSLNTYVRFVILSFCQKDPSVLISFFRKQEMDIKGKFHRFMSIILQISCSSLKKFPFSL